VAYSAKARLLNLMKRPEEAIAAWDEVNARYPNDPWAWHNKSILLRDLGRLEEALVCSERALAIMPFEMARKVGRSIRAKMAEAAGEKPPSGGLNSMLIEENERRIT
jgi:tetratricopeptide (TPR) repeat protein